MPSNQEIFFRNLPPRFHQQRQNLAQQLATSLESNLKLASSSPYNSSEESLSRNEVQSDGSPGMRVTSTSVPIAIKRHPRKKRKSKKAQAVAEDGDDTDTNSNEIFTVGNGNFVQHSEDSGFQSDGYRRRLGSAQASLRGTSAAVDEEDDYGWTFVSKVRGRPAADLSASIQRSRQRSLSGSEPIPARSTVRYCAFVNVCLSIVPFT